MPPSKLNVQPRSPLPINGPVHLVSGPLANHTIRAELDELQKADLGRKCGNKDRRSLDPPPVVRVKLLEVINEGMPNETEKEILISDAGEALAYGFICLVDIFPWPPASHASDSRSQQERSPRSQGTPQAGPSGHGAESLPSFASLLMQVAHDTGASLAIGSAGSPVRLSRLPQTFTPMPGSEAAQRRIAAVINGVPIAEQDSCTQALIGATFVTASCLIYEGKQTLLFIFPDIACNVDGIFLIRYRALNLFSYALETERLPILAECWGGPVTIWATKYFPGLAESTDLTKYISRFGVPVNIRQGERRKRPRHNDEPSEDQSGPSAR